MKNYQLHNSRESVEFASTIATKDFNETEKWEKRF